MNNNRNSVLAVVLARGGSKSIPRKNLKKLRGTPLVSWVLKSLTNTPSVNSVLLSSDDQEILQIGSSEGADIHRRLAIDAGDSTSSEQSLLAALESYDPSRNFQTILLVQPTSPFSRSFHFEEAIGQFFENENDSMVTCTTRNVFQWEISEDGAATSDYDPENRPLRQDRENIYVENGAFFITKRDLLEEKKCRLGGDVGVYVMPYYHNGEIDEPLDWVVLESIAEHMGIIPESPQ